MALLLNRRAAACAAAQELQRLAAQLASQVLHIDGIPENSLRPYAMQQQKLQQGKGGGTLEACPSLSTSLSSVALHPKQDAAEAGAGRSNPAASADRGGQGQPEGRVNASGDKGQEAPQQQKNDPSTGVAKGGGAVKLRELQCGSGWEGLPVLEACAVEEEVKGAVLQQLKLGPMASRGEGARLAVKGLNGRCLCGGDRGSMRHLHLTVVGDAFARWWLVDCA